MELTKEKLLNTCPDYPITSVVNSDQKQDSIKMLSFSRTKISNVLKRRFFIASSFEIYGGSSGLFDLGPPGAALKAELELLWRKHFIINEDMLELSATSLTPYKVLKASGHVDRFTDLMVRDNITQEVFRADQYLEDILENKINLLKPLAIEISDERRNHLIRVAGSLTKEQLTEVYNELEIKSPNGNDLTDPYPFNLMFQTQLGAAQYNPEDPFANIAFLRPETAQGIFVNFRRLLEYNGGKMPFATAQLGTSYRNEIAPRNGLLRVREFPMAEIEHFVHPDHKEHSRFYTVKELKLPLFPRQSQKTDGKIWNHLSLKEAIDQSIILNETHAYFLARTYLFLLKCGIKSEGIRFRQHLENEMSHYASDCWDAEILSSYGWIEAAGHADRSAFDLTNHSRESKQSLTALYKYDTPITKKYMKVIPNRALIGKNFKQDQIYLYEVFDCLEDKKKQEIEENLQKHSSYSLKTENGKIFQLTRDMIKFEPSSKIVSEESYIPHVIEPSFGLGRILHCILEHSFNTRGIEDQEERCFFSLPPEIAPYKCSILPISNNYQFSSLIESLKNTCTLLALTCKLDTTNASIGKRYARTDEIGIPFAITIDFQSLIDNTVTIRERDSMEQIRIDNKIAVSIIKDLVQGTTHWNIISKKFPIFSQQKADS